MTDHRDQLKFIIQRYDVYLNSINTKGSFLLVFKTFLAGALVTNYNTILSKIDTQAGIIGFKLVLAIFLIVVVYAAICVFRAVFPFLKSGNSTIEGYHSLIFFNSVAEFKTDAEFKSKFEDQSDENMRLDLMLQAYQLATGLKSKFKLIERAIICIYVEIVLIVLMLVYLQIF